MREKVAGQCPQTTTFEEKGEPKRIRTGLTSQTGSQHAAFRPAIHRQALTELKRKVWADPRSMFVSESGSGNLGQFTEFTELVAVHIGHTLLATEGDDVMVGFLFGCDKHTSISLAVSAGHSLVGLIQAMLGRGLIQAMSGRGLIQAMLGRGLIQAMSGRGLIQAMLGRGLIQAMLGRGLIQAMPSWAVVWFRLCQVGLWSDSGWVGPWSDSGYVGPWSDKIQAMSGCGLIQAELGHAAFDKTKQTNKQNKKQKIWNKIIIILLFYYFFNIINSVLWVLWVNIRELWNNKPQKNRETILCTSALDTPTFTSTRLSHPCSLTSTRTTWADDHALACIVTTRCSTRGVTWIQSIFTDCSFIICSFCACHCYHKPGGWARAVCPQWDR